MSDIFEIEASLRTDVGKGASRRLRREANLLPAIVYGAGKDPVSLTIEQRKMKKSLEYEAFYSHILTINVNGKKEQVVLKALQRHPVRSEILHADFLRIKANEAITMTIPLHFIGEDVAPGVKEGGKISHQMSDVEIKCLPANLPEFLEVDLSKAELNAIIHLSDIKLPKGVELVAFTHGETKEHDLPIASIHKPKVADTEESAESEEIKPEESGNEASE